MSNLEKWEEKRDNDQDDRYSAIALSWTWLGRLAALRVHGAARVVPKSTFSWLVFWARWDAEGDGGADPWALHGLRAAVQARLAFPPTVQRGCQLERALDVTAEAAPCVQIAG